MVCAWPGMNLSYWPEHEHINQIRLTIVHQQTDDSSPLVLGCAHQLAQAQVYPLQITLIAEQLSPPLVSQVATLPTPLALESNLCNPSLLHLAQLLRAELQAPQVINHLYVASLVMVLVTHLIQDWQATQTTPISLTYS
jgi:hypothetical protein